VAFIKLSGAAGIRTLVQTSSKSAFYMFSLHLIVGKNTRGRHPNIYLILFNFAKPPRNRLN